MNNKSNDTYTVVLVPCNNSENVGTYGEYKTLEEAQVAAKVFEDIQKSYKQCLTTSQLLNFAEDMPVVIKNYERTMSVSWILAHGCGAWTNNDIVIQKA
nr:MAG TPA: Enhancer of rudimentary-like protein [Caudoviricetes sp.]